MNYKHQKHNLSNDDLIFRSPVSPDFPFMGETTNNSTYKPFKTMKNGDKNSNRNVFLISKQI